MHSVKKPFLPNTFLNKTNNLSPSKHTNNNITALPYSCPSVSELQTQVHSMAVGSSKMWHDKKGLAWTIDIPNSVTSPPEISGFYLANWLQNSYTLLCSYLTSGSKTVIFARGNFNVVRPEQIPWQQADDGEMICAGEPASCTFDLLKVKPPAKT